MELSKQSNDGVREAMKMRIKKLMDILDKVKPGEMPNTLDDLLACRDVEKAAGILAEQIHKSMTTKKDD